ncbi:uncharacterized protein [Oscarella lobularis]|uniref:uncharacterized protein isoform X3 n=1 Tax=Oscarella lobularis TaxID=121494 RepID=UPI003313360F
MTSKRRRLSYNARYSYEPIALLRQNATNHRRFYSTTTKNGLCSCGEVKRLSIGNWKKTKGDENMISECTYWTSEKIGQRSVEKSSSRGVWPREIGTFILLLVQQKSSHMQYEAMQL